MIDEGSDTTLVREGLDRQLGLSGEARSLDIVGVRGRCSRVSSQQVRLQLRAPSGEFITVEGSTIPTVTRPAAMVDWATLRAHCVHFSDLPVQSSGGGGGASGLAAGIKPWRLAGSDRYGRGTAKKVKRCCTRCLKERARPVVQLMGDLPASRLACSLAS